jgi:hypothetical protein
VTRRTLFALATALCGVLSTPLLAQGPPGGRGGPPPTGRAGAQVDLTGYWVSIVSEDWRWRMITPPKGDYSNIPVNPEGRRVADTWDWAKDESAGEQCKAYSAPAIMREPGRLHITWQDDNTLKVDTDAGTQTRTFQFAAAPPATTSQGGERSWQGVSVARWEAPPRAAAGGSIPLGLGPRVPGGRTLEVTTTQIRPGYLRKNGVPFSPNPVVQEYFDGFKDPDGTEWFVVTTVVTDPQYLTAPWVTTSHFRKEPDASKWNPQPCRVR